MQSDKLFIELPEKRSVKKNIHIHDRKRELIENQKIGKRNSSSKISKNKIEFNSKDYNIFLKKHVIKALLYISIFVVSFILMIPFLIQIHSNMWEKKIPIHIEDDILYNQFLIAGIDIDNSKVKSKGDNLTTYNIPQFRIIKYKVKRGDSLFSIAQKFNTSIDAIITANRLKNAYYLQINRILYVPNTSGIFYTVKRGDNLSRIASKHHSRVNEIADINDLASPVIRKGERIFIPNASLSNWERAVALGNIFKSPVKGRLTSRMGFRKDPFTGRLAYHPGIDIANRRGTPIYSSQFGRIIYTGYRGGYGKTIMIAHPKGYVTLYGHLSRILVRRGQVVKQRQLIAKMGNTGRSTGPHLHFEIHHGGKLVNPLKMIKVYR